MKVEATNKEEAISKMKSMMTEAMVAEHMAAKHPGDPVPATAQVHAMIEQKLA
jgi:hypothetical protein